MRQPTLIKIEPWSRINDRFLDGTIATEIPKNRISHPLLANDGGSNTVRFLSDFYCHIALDLVSETVFDYPYPYITEKTLRPIANQRMFMIMGAAGTLSVLKHNGFLTWDDILDESYDGIKDPCERFRSIVQSFRKFCDLDIDHIRSYLHDNQHKFRHNLETLRSQRNKDFDRLKKLAL